VLILVFILGTIMYLVEGGENGFDSIPQSIYWAIVTLTTVGFGDITPDTVVGQMIASVIMLLGYSIIAIPTGIVGAEIYMGATARRTDEINRSLMCMSCRVEGQRYNADYCRGCVTKLRASES